MSFDSMVDQDSDLKNGLFKGHNQVSKRVVFQMLYISHKLRTPAMIDPRYFGLVGRSEKWVGRLNVKFYGILGTTSERKISIVNSW